MKGKEQILGRVSLAKNKLNSVDGLIAAQRTAIVDGDISRLRGIQEELERAVKGLHPLLAQVKTDLHRLRG